MATKRKPGITYPVSSKHLEGGLVEFVIVLRAIDMNAPIAKLNATSISDNNGGRIEL